MLFVLFAIILCIFMLHAIISDSLIICNLLKPVRQYEYQQLVDIFYVGQVYLGKVSDGSSDRTFMEDPLSSSQ